MTPSRRRFLGLFRVGRQQQIDQHALRIGVRGRELAHLTQFGDRPLTIIERTGEDFGEEATRLRLCLRHRAGIFRVCDHFERVGSFAKRALLLIRLRRVKKQLRVLWIMLQSVCKQRDHARIFVAQMLAHIGGAHGERRLFARCLVR